jgi:hypothetical protein
VIQGGRLFLQRGLRVSAPFLEANGPVIAVGRSLKQTDGTGPVTLSGDLRVGATGSLVADLDGTGASFVVEGNAALDGTLELRFADEAGLDAGAAFDVLDVAGKVTGDFAEVRFPTRSDDFEAEFTNEGGALRLVVTNPGQPVGEGEGEGEGEPPVPGCNGCQSPDGKHLTWGTSWGNWILLFLSTAILLGTGMQRRKLDAEVR